MGRSGLQRRLPNTARVDLQQTLRERSNQGGPSSIPSHNPVYLSNNGTDQRSMAVRLWSTVRPLMTPDPSIISPLQSVWWPGDCCWKCLSCKQTQFIRDEFTCEECPKGFAPNANLTGELGGIRQSNHKNSNPSSVLQRPPVSSVGCYAIPEEFIQWKDSAALLVIVVASVGIGTTCLVTLIFVQHNLTPVVKSSTRELSYIILVGMVMSHGTSLAFLFKVSSRSSASPPSSADLDDFRPLVIPRALSGCSVERPLVAVSSAD